MKFQLQNNETFTVSGYKNNVAKSINIFDIPTDLSSYVTSGYYDTSTRKIYLRHGTNVLSEIDANDFIKDGMVDTAYVQGSYLVISFNGDAEKIPVQIPIADIFNPNNYYTKSQVDSNVIHLTGDPYFNGKSTVTCAWEVDAGIPSNYSSNLLTKLQNYAPQELAWEANYDCYEAICQLFPSGGTTNVLTITQKMYKALNTASVEIDEEIMTTFYASNPTSYVVISDYTDPTVPSYVKEITETDINNWSSYANVQSDWNETNSTLNSYILNKPTIPNGLPTVSSTDNGKVLQVVNGEWSLVSPVTLYTGTGTPNNSQGNNGDLYMQI